MVIRESCVLARPHTRVQPRCLMRVLQCRQADMGEERQGANEREKGRNDRFRDGGDVCIAHEQEQRGRAQASLVNGNGDVKQWSSWSLEGWVPRHLCRAGECEMDANTHTHPGGVGSCVALGWFHGSACLHRHCALAGDIAFQRWAGGLHQHGHDSWIRSLVCRKRVAYTILKIWNNFKNLNAAGHFSRFSGILSTSQERSTFRDAHMHAAIPEKLVYLGSSFLL